ncbi:unnamed protein product [Adineta steineri]|uniref:SAM domain-containing protein n=1 Tax=Adineta steineri TaxID=433720 RepID=A0A819CLI2_9BILA|nr:unnamed protein product [Adineta steineri]CAF3814354.1 unnamed protein product [Adineta steineri]
MEAVDMDTADSEAASTTQESACSGDPSAWSTLDVIAWLQKCHLGQFATSFQENEVDGSVLMSDGFDDNMIKELIPSFKQRVVFNSERKKLSQATRLAVVNADNATDVLEISKPALEPQMPATDSNTVHIFQPEASCPRK